jgi:hypothetical protein
VGGRCRVSYRAAHHRTCAAQRQFSTPQTPDVSSTSKSTPTPIPLRIRHPTAPRAERRSERCCRWRVTMSEFHRQNAFIPQTFIEVSAGGRFVVRETCRDNVNVCSLSGPNQFDVANLFHDHDYHALPHPLQIPQDGYAHGEFAYSTGVSVPGKRVALFISNPNSASQSDAICIPCNSCTSYSLLSLPVVSRPRRWVARSQ